MPEPSSPAAVTESLVHGVGIESRDRMKLLDVIHRPVTPGPWTEGDNIPWDDPAFSQRMLKEHLSQAHDKASRRIDKVNLHVDWIHRRLLAGRATRILDLGCGPGCTPAGWPGWDTSVWASISPRPPSPTLKTLQRRRASGARICTRTSGRPNTAAGMVW